MVSEIVDMLHSNTSSPSH